MLSILDIQNIGSSPKLRINCSATFRESSGKKLEARGVPDNTKYLILPTLKKRLRNLAKLKYMLILTADSSIDYRIWSNLFSRDCLKSVKYKGTAMKDRLIWDHFHLLVKRRIKLTNFHSIGSKIKINHKEIAQI